MSNRAIGGHFIGAIILFPLETFGLIVPKACVQL